MFFEVTVNAVRTNTEPLAPTETDLGSWEPLVPTCPIHQSILSVFLLKDTLLTHTVDPSPLKSTAPSSFPRELT